MNRAQILEAVEALRLRKCRPEREAIAHHILKRHGAQFQDIFNDLETIVDQGDLIKVEYKGSISYRSPDAFDTKSSPLLTKHSKILNSNRTTRFILTAITELLAENELYSNQGIPHKAIHSKLVEYDSTRFTIVNIPIFLQREVTVGTLVTTSQGHLLPRDLYSTLTTDGSTPSDSSPTKMRGRKPAVSKSVDTTPTTSTAAATTAENTSEVFAVKSLPVVPASESMTKTKPIRSYGRKSTAVVAAEKDEAKEKDDKEEAVIPKDEAVEAKNCVEKSVKVVTPPEEPMTGRISVRNKRKKEVFDPSDLPKKRPSVPTTPAPTVKVEKEKVSPAASPTKPTKRPYRKRVKEPPVLEKETAAVLPTPTLCEHCQRQKNIRGQIEAFLVCSDCTVSYHPSCLEYVKKQASLLIDKGTWQCSDCKACQVCQEQSVKGPETILCSSCDMGFHYKCLKLAVKPDVESWLCPGCRGETKSEGESGEELKVKMEVDEPVPDEKKPIIDEEIKSDKPEEEIQEGKTEVKTEEEEQPAIKIEEKPQPKKPAVKGRPRKRIFTFDLEKKKDAETATKVKEEETGNETVSASVSEGGVKEEVKEVDDLDIPTDASKWTPSQVEAYFKKHGLREEGILFREQEIDGLSLLLMRRQDIVNGMKLLLGPALKVFKIVASLQQSGGKVDSTTTL